MTGAGMFALDTNTYLTSLSGALLATGATTGATSQAQTFTDGVTLSNLSSYSGNLASIGSGGSLSNSGIAAGNVALLNANQAFTGTGTSSFGGTLNFPNVSIYPARADGFAWLEQTITDSSAGHGEVGMSFVNGGSGGKTYDLYSTNSASSRCPTGSFGIGDVTDTKPVFCVSNTGATISNASGVMTAPCLADGTGGGVCGGAIPLYNTSGAAITGQHSVSGDAFTSGSSVTFTFSGAAAFTSSGTYSCLYGTIAASYAGTLSYTEASGTSVTFNGTVPSFQVNFTCTGY
jgi:hypothetical protein